MYGESEYRVYDLRIKTLTLLQAESELSILGTETNPRSHTGPPSASLPLPVCLDLSDADILVRTSDLASFRVHKSVLASSSPLFKDLLALPQPPNNGMIDGLPVVDISEDAELTRSLITLLYPIPSEIPTSYDRVLALLAAAQKYDMDDVQSSIRAEIAHRPSLTGDPLQAFRAYAIASGNGLTPEMNTAARDTLDYPMTFEHLGEELRLCDGWAVRRLALFRKGCRDNLILCLQSFLDVVNGPSKIWVDCPQHSASSSALRSQRQLRPQKTPPTLPAWLHDLFTPRIEELKTAFKHPLIKPAIIRDKYMEALRIHAAPDTCTVCLGVHTMKGDWYCMQLEQALAMALDKVSVCLPFQSRVS